jgi:6-pyruvoyltetrahydropterin/6-carboxytetrahydropterin synthase
MKAYFSRRYRFSASHRLHNDAYSEQENREIYGKCNNPHGHGHNYILEVTAAGQIDPQTGMVCDMAKLDQAVRKKVIDRFDHTNLNLDASFRNLVPTTENLCIEIHQNLLPVFASGELGQAMLARVRIEETENNFFEYAGI